MKFHIKMTSSIAIVLIFMIIMGLQISADDFSEGSGSINDPYIITTPEQLNNMRNDLTAYYKLGNNIDMSGFGNFEPIGDYYNNFTGSFNGDGYKIQNLTINSTYENVGLFGYIGNGGRVENVGLVGGIIKGIGNVGSLAGTNSGMITNCYNTGSVTGIGAFVSVGGIIGMNYTEKIATVTNCYNTGEIKGTGTDEICVGGITGMNYNIIIGYCYNTGEVTGEGGEICIGGVAGTNYGGIIGYCYNTNNVAIKNGSEICSGGVVGLNFAGSIINCYYNTDTGGVITGVGNEFGSSTNVTGYDSLYMTSDEFFYELGNDQIWYKHNNATDTCCGSVRYYPELKVFEGSDMSRLSVMVDINAFLNNRNEESFTHGDGTSDNPYKIYTTKQLNHVRLHLDASFELMKDINMSGFGNFAPIGEDENNSFTGTFDGNGYTIQNLTINCTDADYAGLFGFIGNSGEVKNVGLSGCMITGINNVGGLAGCNWGTIENCYNAGSITGDLYTGGIAGVNDGTVTNCYNTGVITGTDNMGGIVGDNNGTIANCYNIGKFTGNGNTGGIVGNNGGTITNCYFDTDISGVIYGVGTGDNTGAEGLTTADMVNIGFAEKLGSAWVRRDYDNNYCYYPELIVFFDSEISKSIVQVERRGLIVSATASDIRYSETLSESVISGKAVYNSVDVAGVFDWIGGNQILDIGTQKAQAAFIPENILYRETTIYISVFVKNNWSMINPVTGLQTTGNTAAGQSGTLFDNIDPSKGSYTIELGGDSSYIDIPADVLRNLYNNNPDFIIEIVTPYGTYYLPVDFAGSGNISYRISIKNMSGDKIFNDIFNREFPNGKLLAAVEFIIEIIDLNTNQVIGAVDVFNNPVRRTLNVNGDLNGSWGAFRYNEVTGKFEFVPHNLMNGQVSIGYPGNSIYVVAQNTVEFPDVDSDSWYQSYVTKAAAKFLIRGLETGLYEPERDVTRAEFVQMIVNAVSLPDYKAMLNKYDDVKSGDWYYEAVMKSKSAGLLDKFTSSNFNPDKAITREEIAVILAAVVKYENYAVTGEKADLSEIFADYNDMKKTFESEIELVYRAGLMQGIGGDIFDPKGVVTRAQAVTVQIRLLELLGLID